MSSKVHQKLIQLASRVENTPELQTYWFKRYKYILDNSLFEISERTQQLVHSGDVLTRPATVFGSIVLPSFLKGTEIDEERLQSTIETATRLLDSFLDIINFDQPSKELVRRYRKIGIGISQFDVLLSERGGESEIDTIDLVGALISSYTYRASESLAEEKGVCVSWDEIETQLRPKVFEYWYNENTSEIKNGLELTEEFDQDTITESGFVKMRRRNSDLLIFPQSKEWEIWNDRTENPATILPTQHQEDAAISNTDTKESKMITHDNLEVLSVPTHQNDKDTQSIPSLSQEEKDKPAKEDKQKVDEVLQIQVTNNSSTSTQNRPNALHFDAALSQRNSGDESTKIDRENDDKLQLNSSDSINTNNSDEIMTAVENNPSNEIHPKIYFDNGVDVPAEEQDEDQNNALKLTNASTVSEDTIDSNNLSELVNDSPLPKDITNIIHVENVDEISSNEHMFDEYQIGELVYIHKVESEYHEHIYQIGDIVFFHSQIGYKLIGNPKVEHIVWKPNELRPAELDSIIQRLNNVVKSEDKQASVYSVHCVIDSQGQIIIDSKTGFLPVHNWDFAQEPDVTSNGIFKHSDFQFQTISIEVDQPNNTLYIICISLDNTIDQSVYSAAQISTLSPTSSLNKSILNTISTYYRNHLQSQRELSELRYQLEHLQNTTDSAIKVNQTDIQPAPQSSQSIVATATDHSYVPLESNETAMHYPLQLNNNPNQNNVAEKIHRIYTLKLEQQVKTNAFGDVIITFIYDSNGLQIGSIDSKNVNQNDMIIITSFVSLINAILNHGVNKNDICEMLIDHIIISDSNITIMQMLHVIAAALAEVPNEIRSIQVESLQTAATRYNQKLLTSTSQSRPALT